MNSRINNGEPPQQEKPQSMEDLLGQAHNDWKFKRRDEAFMKVLNALAMMSTGVAQAMKKTEEIGRGWVSEVPNTFDLSREDLLQGLQSQPIDKITIHSFKQEFLDKIVSSRIVCFKDGEEFKVLKNRDGKLE